MSQQQNKALTPPPHLSPSSLSTFEQCPLKFKFNKIDLIPDKPGIEAVMGNYVHDVLEGLYGLDPIARTKDAARGLARDIFYDKYAETVGKILHREEAIRKLRWQAWFCIDNLWKVEDPTKVVPIGLEHELNHPLGGVMLKGFIDRYSRHGENGLTISDYKTGKTPRAAWISDKFEQLRIYAALMAETQLFPVESLELIYLKDGVKFTEQVTDELQEATIVRITKNKSLVDERCETGIFEATKSRLCDWCSYKSICPAWGK